MGEGCSRISELGMVILAFKSPKKLGSTRRMRAVLENFGLFREKSFDFKLVDQKFWPKFWMTLANVFRFLNLEEY